MDSEQDDPVTIDLTDPLWSVDGHGDVFTISPNHCGTLNIGATGSILTTNSTYLGPNVSPNWTFTDLSTTSSPSGKISLRGDDADIEINGESVVSMLKDIRDRLNILQVSEEMEQEWDELRALREQYEAKLAECREKSRAWNALKQAG